MADFENIQHFRTCITCKCIHGAVSSKILNSSGAVHFINFNCYLDRILLLSNCIGPKARGLTMTYLYNNISASIWILILGILFNPIHDLYTVTLKRSVQKRA
jgi:hypothetical protein